MAKKFASDCRLRATAVFCTTVLMLGCEGSTVGTGVEAGSESSSSVAVETRLGCPQGAPKALIPVPDDSDGDGLSDSDELSAGTNPNDPHDPTPHGAEDLDGDGMSNGRDEDYRGDIDCDGDGLSNQMEYDLGMSPVNAEARLHASVVRKIASPGAPIIVNIRSFRHSGAALADVPVSVSLQATAGDPEALQFSAPPAARTGADGSLTLELRAAALGDAALDVFLDDDPEQRVRIDDLKAVSATERWNPDDSLREFSSIFGGEAPGTGHGRSMLGAEQGWSPQTRTANEWVELPVPEDALVTAVVLQQRTDQPQYLTQATLTATTALGHLLQFDTSENLEYIDGEVVIPLENPIATKSLRIQAKTWSSYPSARLGLEIVRTTNDREPVTADDSDGDGFSDSRELMIGSDPANPQSPSLYDPPVAERAFSSVYDNPLCQGGDLSVNAWCAEAGDVKPWTDLPIPADKRVVGLRVTGRPGVDQWVKTARLSTPGTLRVQDALQPNHLYTFNDDHSTDVDVMLAPNEAANFLRIEVQSWHSHPSMRAALWLVDKVASKELDSDNDGLSDLLEVAHGSDPQLADSDGDGIGDAAEWQSGSSSTNRDSDGDGIEDGIEQSIGGNWNDANHPPKTEREDADGDGLPAVLEAKLGTDPNNADSDGDGLSDKHEYWLSHTLPLKADSDGDLLDDGKELQHGSDPLNGQSPISNGWLDVDDDNLSNAQEAFYGTDANSADIDADGLRDDDEIRAGSDPYDGQSPIADGHLDRDQDGLTAAYEHHHGSDDNDPNSPITHGALDHDFDGIPNAIDYTYDPHADMDNDGLSNAVELAADQAAHLPDDPMPGAAQDMDGDGVANHSDADYGGQGDLDGDGDGLSNADEYRAGSDPSSLLSPSAGATFDLDGDGLGNAVDPDYDGLADADGDGYNNESEYRSGTDPSVANNAADFSDAALQAVSREGGLMLEYALPASPTGEGLYFTQNDLYLPTVQVLETEFLGRHLDPYGYGFNVTALSIETDDQGQVWLVNDTPRVFSGLGLIDSDEQLYRVDSYIPNFSRNRLNLALPQARVIDPAPFSKTIVSRYIPHSTAGSIQRVNEQYVDEYDRMIVGAKLLYNYPALWDRYFDYAFQCNAQGSGYTICVDGNEDFIQEAFNRNLHIQKPIEHGFLWRSGYTGLAWGSRQTQALYSIDSYNIYHHERNHNLGYGHSSGLTYGFSPQLDVVASTHKVFLMSPNERDEPMWEEAPRFYRSTVNANDRSVEVELFSHWALDRVYAFSNATTDAFESAQFLGAQKRMRFVLSQSQWDAGVLSLMFFNSEQLEQAIPVEVTLPSSTPSSDFVGQELLFACDDELDDTGACID